jgi:hypothetical protein
LFAQITFTIFGVAGQWLPKLAVIWQMSVLGPVLSWAGWQAWHTYGGGSAKPELCGIWAVREFSVEGKLLPPLTTDQSRWQRLVVEKPGAVTYQRMNGELVDAPATVSADTITMSEPSGTTLADLRVSRPSTHQLQLTGTVQGCPVQIALEQLDLNQFTLRNRGFHWAQEYPFFR